jgi:hypothetical protein
VPGHGFLLKNQTVALLDETGDFVLAKLATNERITLRRITL